ncbi:hypothetical protein VT03_17225 [Planctomyces sp. SH-PL14]|nr:hypothetical protein [Planctomyces sp. SH-PL14]AMV19641.1 hypothetical protein VT03_17225 [Planctomyces sp. SH-PL14]
MKAYSMDLRNRVLADCDAGMEARQVAVKYNAVSLGSDASARDGGRAVKRLPGDRRRLLPNGNLMLTRLSSS